MFDPYAEISFVFPTRLAKLAPDREIDFWRQVLRSTRAHAVSMFARAPDGDISAKNNGRDAQMADNLVWLAKTRYPKRKIIVWAATMHILRRPWTIDPRYDGLRTMGHLAWEQLGEAIYSIGFLSSEGTMGTWKASAPRALPTPVEGSLESLLARTSHAYAFLDLKHLAKGGEWLREKLSASPLGYSGMSARWPEALDALIYTRVMRPATSSLR